MNDRFKFRVWDVQEQKYIYFDLLNSESLNDFAFFAEDETPDYDEQVKLTDSNCWELIIEQCTGLKDKNGKLIYDNDLIKISNELYRVAIDDFGCRTVILDNNPFTEVIEWSDIVKIYYFNNRVDEIEVIGNVHENHELLEQSNDD